jgi:hypothetical protein
MVDGPMPGVKREWLDEHAGTEKFLPWRVAVPSAPRLPESRKRLPSVLGRAKIPIRTRPRRRRRGPRRAPVAGAGHADTALKHVPMGTHCPSFSVILASYGTGVVSRIVTMR